MKTTIKTFGLFAAALLLTTSCSDDFLTVTKPDGDPLEEYYVNDQRINEALNAAYDPIHWPDWGLGQYNALNIDAEIMGDDFWVGGETKTDMKNWHMLSNFVADENNTLSSLWTVNYSGIKRCNDLLRYLGWVDTSVTPENKKSYEMQARCMRVYYYNMLWHYFGNIPFYLENLTAATNYCAPQKTADEVYAELISELEAVIDSKVLPMRWEDSQSGRASQAMAYMMYAEMVTYQNDKDRFGKALDYMKEIINSGKYALNPDFANLWDESGEWCSESIWEINYEDGGNDRGWNSPLATGGTIMPTLISPNNYVLSDRWGDGWGFLPMRVETYDMYAEGDVRRDATVWDLRHLEGLAEENSYHLRYENTYLWLNKYRPKAENNADAAYDNNLNFNNNYRYYRYAECLLYAAELAVRTGSGNGQAWFDEVRSRAGLSSITANLDNIIEERHLEFVGEGKRYWDLVRMVDVPESSVNAQNKLVAEGYRENNWTKNKKYIPIAQAELDSDPALKQNNY
ncbi:MAG: RagB/SusD family nutrient uptake outer membrane protein [Prevotellaceae bacterium]|nr:RagB/SusD family nutrient uptake outer membrane protein [Prevotellaceae bacterium]